MENTEVFETVKKFATDNIAVRTLMKALPHDTEIKLYVSERYTAFLSFKNEEVLFTEAPVGTPEFEMNIATEAVRRISQSKPESLAELLEELGRESLSGKISWKVKASPKELWDRGHILTAKRLYPHLQAELMQKLMVALGAANVLYESAKSKVSEYWK